MWFLFQAAIMIAVAGTGVKYHWSANPYAIGVVAVAAAWLGTKLLSLKIRIAGRRRPKV